MRGPPPPSGPLKTCKFQFFELLAASGSSATVYSLQSAVYSLQSTVKTVNWGVPAQPRGRPRPSAAPTKNLQKPMRIQYFMPRTHPKPPATIPELPGSDRLPISHSAGLGGCAKRKQSAGPLPVKGCHGRAQNRQVLFLANIWPLESPARTRRTPAGVAPVVRSWVL